MSEKLTRIEFAEEFRCFAKGRAFEFNDGLTLITGDNGSGKSSLVGCIRSLYSKTTWTYSDLGASHVLVNQPVDEACLYIDLNMDLLRNRLDLDYDNLALHTSVLHKSAGQGSLIQLVTMLTQTKCKMVIIDEPERGLSEANQFLASKCVEKFCIDNPDVQVILTTHSSVFMEVLSALSPIHIMPMFKPVSIEKYHEYNKIMGELMWSTYLNGVNGNG
ncbi:AAA family ATPase [Vibrio splendidus]|nr:AAA family ATPase [Vibrio splendidus]MCC4883204.1 AAA family ATPase [Vibrio splendidus]